MEEKELNLYPGQIWVNKDNSMFCEILSIHRYTKKPWKVSWTDGENEITGPIDKLLLWIIQNEARPVVEVFKEYY